MAQGNKILITSAPKGNFVEGIILTAEKPGTIVQIDPTVTAASGRHTFVVYNRDADGDRPLGPYMVLLEDAFQGKTATDAYTAGDRCFAYCPLPGDELNLLYMNVAGTGDDVVAGNLGIVDDGTGKVLVTTGSPECEPFVFMEAYTDPTADRLLWCMWSGH